MLGVQRGSRGPGATDWAFGEVARVGSMRDSDSARLERINAQSAHLGHRRKAAKPGVVASRVPKAPRRRVQTEMHWDRRRYLKPGLDPYLTPELELYGVEPALHMEPQSGQLSLLEG